VLIKYSVDLYSCDLLFVHRDAERESHANRKQEIYAALGQMQASIVVPPIICVVPVRMQEAWLLFDESTLRAAAGNPHGSQILQLPRIADLERLPDPKTILHNLLREASGLSGRRRKQVPVSVYAHRLAELVDDFSALRALSAFRSLEADINQLVTDNGWR